MKKLILSLIIGILCIASTAYGEIYTYDETEDIMNGVRLRQIRRFYGDSWQNITAIIADLTEPNLKLELLKGANVDSLTSMAGLVSSQDNVLAAANADFFDNTIPAYSQGFSLGIEVKDGELLQSQVDESMAAAFFDGERLSLDYMSMSIVITAPGGETQPLRHLNKHTDYYGDILMYTSNWNNGYSPAPGNEVVEVVVVDDVVTEFRRNMPPVQIPENGYVLVVSEGVNMFLANNFQVGDPIGLNVYATPSLEGIETAFGGGTLLLKDGVKTKFTHIIAGNQPRTCVGTNADGTVVYIITVDGRQYASQGATLDGLAGIALELGCVNAMNLDGGGSTRMMAKTFWNSEHHVVNLPTENRKVINGISITSDAPSGEAVGVKLRTDVSTLLAGDSINIENRFYDEFGGVARSHAEEPKWSFEGVKGHMVGSVFTPTSSGRAKITAEYNGVISEPIYIDVIENVSCIGMPQEINLKVGESYRIAPDVSGGGHTAAVCEPGLLSPTVSDPGVTALENGTITGLAPGYSLLTLSHGEAVTYTLIKVGEPDEASPELPDRIFVDEANGEISGGNSFSVFACGSTANTMFANILYRKGLRTIAASDSYGFLGDYKADSLPDGLRTPICANSYSAIDKGFALVISLPSSGQLSGNDWRSMTNAIAATKAENIIVLTNASPNGRVAADTAVFYDYFDMISQTKNVYIVQSGLANSLTMRNKVRLLTLADSAGYGDMISAFDDTWVLKFTMDGSECRYTFEKVFDFVDYVTDEEAIWQ